MAIRSDLTASHDRLWEQLAGPGTWLTGAERVAVAAELRAARRCALCIERKASLSPAAVSGEHEGPGVEMSAARRELIHKLVTDPGRITRSWAEGLFASGVTDAEYVEVAGLASAVVVVDTFHAAVGLPERELPAPRPGEPTRVRPRTAAPEEAFVPLVAADALEGDYADLYEAGAWVPNVHRAFSLVPAVTRIANDLMQSHYLPYEQVPIYTDADHERAVDKMQMELIASRVSRHNDCFY